MEGFFLFVLHWRYISRVYKSYLNHQTLTSNSFVELLSFSNRLANVVSDARYMIIYKNGRTDIKQEQLHLEVDFFSDTGLVHTNTNNKINTFRSDTF